MAPLIYTMSLISLGFIMQAETGCDRACAIPGQSMAFALLKTGYKFGGNRTRYGYP